MNSGAPMRGIGNRRLRPRNAVAVAGIVMLLAVGAGGCASAGTTEVRTPPSARMQLVRTAIVQVDSTVPNSENTTRELEGAIVEQLRQRRVFDTVYSRLSAQGRSADVTLRVTITDFTGVAELPRALVGAFAGQSVIGADVVLTGTDGEALGAARVEGKSSAGHAFAGTTMEAIQRTAEQVAGFVTRK